MSEVGTLVGFISVAILVIIQIAIFAYTYGKTTQKLNDVCKSQIALQADAQIARTERVTLIQKVAVLESKVTRGATS